MSRRLQFVWWLHPRDWHMGFERPDPLWGLAGIYDWFLHVGPLEIRRWTNVR